MLGAFFRVLFTLSWYAQDTSLVPRYFDVLDGRVCAMQAGAIVTANSAASDSVTLTAAPIGDWPAVVADQGVVKFNAPRRGTRAYACFETGC